MLTWSEMPCAPWPTSNSARGQTKSAHEKRPDKHQVFLFGHILQLKSGEKAEPRQFCGPTKLG